MNAVKKTIFPLLLASLFFSAKSQTAPDNVAFQAGEELVYAASYSVVMLQPNIATIKFNVTNSTVSGVPAFRVTAVAEVDSKFKWVFDMRDEYNTWLDRKTLRPLYFSNNIKEGSYRFVSSYLYDWNKMQVTNQYKNLKYNQPHEKTMPLTAKSYDGVAMFFNMRSSIPSDLKPGYTDYIEIVMSDTVQRIQYKFIGFEERNISRLGKYRTMKFSCQLANAADHDAFQDGSEFFVWFSDDKNRIPLYLETPIRIGSVKCYLSGYKGLKYPLGGKVK